MAYKNPIPVAVALVPIQLPGGDLRLLGVVRNIEPVGGIALPGGYVDEGESAEMAASRELRQETGADIPPPEFRPFMTRVTPNNRLLVFCIADISLAKDTYWSLKAAKAWDPVETQDLDVLTPASKLCFPLHQEAMDAFFARIARGEKL